MSYITGNDPVKKDERGNLSFDKEAFIFATNFASDTYFADDLNWKRIALYFTDPTSNQRQIVVLKDEYGNGWFAPSSTARTGSWSLSSIEIFDQDGDSFVVERSNMPSPENFDVAVERVIAPASLITNIPTPVEIIVNGDFPNDVANWDGDGASAVWSNQKAYWAYHDDRSFYQTIPTVPGFTYSFNALMSGLVAATNSLATVKVFPGTVTDTRNGTSIESWHYEQTVHGSGDVDIEHEFTAVGLTTNIAFGTGGNAAAAASFDDISVLALPNTLQITPGEGLFYKQGYKVKIWSDTDSDFLDSTVYEITEILADFITLDKQLPPSYVGKTLRLRFPNYSSVSGEQATKYEYVEAGY